MATKTPPRRRQSNPPYDWLARGWRPYQGSAVRFEKAPDGTRRLVPCGTDHGWQGPLPFPHVDLRYWDGRWHTLRADDPRALRPWEHNYRVPDTDENLVLLAAELRAAGVNAAKVLADHLGWERRRPSGKIDMDGAIRWLQLHPSWLAHPQVLNLTTYTAAQLRRSSALGIPDNKVYETPDKSEARRRMRQITAALLRETDAAATTARHTKAREALYLVETLGWEEGAKRARRELGFKSESAIRSAIRRAVEEQRDPALVEMHHVPFPRKRPLGRPRKKK